MIKKRRKSKPSLAVCIVAVILFIFYTAASLVLLMMSFTPEAATAVNTPAAIFYVFIGLFAGAAVYLLWIIAYNGAERRETRVPPDRKDRDENDDDE